MQVDMPPLVVRFPGRGVHLTSKATFNVLGVDWRKVAKNYSIKTSVVLEVDGVAGDATPYPAEVAFYRNTTVVNIRSSEARAMLKGMARVGIRREDDDTIVLLLRSPAAGAEAAEAVADAPGGTSSSRLDVGALTSMLRDNVDMADVDAAVASARERVREATVVARAAGIVEDAQRMERDVRVIEFVERETASGLGCLPADEVAAMEVLFGGCMRRLRRLVENIKASQPVGVLPDLDGAVGQASSSMNADTVRGLHSALMPIVAQLRDMTGGLARADAQSRLDEECARATKLESLAELVKLAVQ
jgi:hypothetical protein